MTVATESVLRGPNGIRRRTLKHRPTERSDTRPILTQGVEHVGFGLGCTARDLGSQRRPAASGTSSYTYTRL
jgi:hypothetical protein